MSTSNPLSLSETYQRIMPSVARQVGIIGHNTVFVDNRDRAPTAFRSVETSCVQHSGWFTARPPRLVSLNLTLISSPGWRIA
jgi:hypothetical protein